MKIKDKFEIIKEKFLNELFPEDITCNFCGKEIKNKNKYNLCGDCLSKILPIKHPCKICGDELNSFTKVCDNCKNNKRYFDYVSSATVYDGIAKTIAQKLKFRGCAYLSKTVGAFLADTFYNGKYDLIDIVTCVPISKNKLKVRGYNQAEEILKEFIKYFNFPYNTTSLILNKEVSTQVNLSRIERRNNLVDSFKVIDKDVFMGKNVLVIDDIITTGSTLDEVAKVLKENGANKVFGLTFCHTQTKVQE